jgi:hypothetical protein
VAAKRPFILLSVEYEVFSLLEQAVAQETTMGGGHSAIQGAGMAVRGDVVVTLPQQSRRF